MSKKVLVIGGCGRIGQSVAQDLINYTDTEVIVTSRQEKNLKSPLKFLRLDLENLEQLKSTIKAFDLVIHCAGPFHYRDGRVLKICLELGINYIDVSDHSSFYKKVIEDKDQAIQAGVTAILNTGIFPGISNSMVRQGVEQFDHPKKIHLSYVVAGSGGAGITVMRTTFLGLRQEFEAWIDGKWQKILPYTQREVIEFPQPYGKTGVYWFDVPETYTFPHSFPVETVVTKFGSVPDFYNHLTWITAHVFPTAWIESNRGIEFFSQVSYLMTSVTDKFSGIGVAMRAEITGQKDDQEKKYCTMMVHSNTAIAAGAGTGIVAQLLLEGKLQQPGIYPVEQALSTDLFTEGLRNRGITIESKWID